MRRTIVFMSLAAFGALLAAVVVFSALKKREADVQRAMAHTAEVVVATHAIPLGAKLQATDVKLARWSRESMPDGSFTDLKAPVGSFAIGQFAANEPIVGGRLLVGDKTAGVMPFLIPPGMRAMSVPVDEVAGISGFLQPHNRVDVLLAVSASGPSEPPFSRIVAQNIEILAIAQEIEKVKDEPEVVKVVTLLVTPADAEKLLLATREGTIRLAMRSYGDSKILAASGISIDDLMRHAHAEVPLMEKQPVAPPPGPRPIARKAHGPTPYQIEILRDGKSSEAYSFVNSAVVGHSGGADRDASPTSAAPAPTLSPDDDQSPEPSAMHSASMVGAPGPALAAVLNATSPRVSSRRPTLALRPGDIGYVPAPKTFEIGPK